MNSLFNMLWRKPRMLAIALALALLAVIPVGSIAGEEMGLDVGQRNGRGREGDPLDTNDYPSGEDPTDNPHDTAGKAGRVLFGSDFWSANVILMPQYNGTTITFRIIFLTDVSQFLEGRDAK